MSKKYTPKILKFMNFKNQRITKFETNKPRFIVTSKNLKFL